MPVTTTPENPDTTDWRKLHAFGWPAGSVRAVMALLVFGTIWALLVLKPDQEVPEYLKDLLFIILGHYFATRAGQRQEPGPSPLYLPRGSVRVLLVAGFVGSAVWLYREGRLAAIDRNPAVATLLLVAGFLLGVVLRHLVTSLGGQDRQLPRFVEDARAFVSLAATIFLAVVVWDHFFPASSPHWRLDEVNLGLGRIGLPHLAAAFVGFYFGSRS